MIRLVRISIVGIGIVAKLKGLFFVLDNTTKWIVESKHHSDLVVMKCLQTDDDSSHDTLLSPT